MRKYTVNDLWAFVNRADTMDEIKTAIAFFEKANIEVLNDDYDLYDDLMNSLAYKLREAYHEKEATDGIGWEQEEA